MQTYNLTKLLAAALTAILFTLSAGGAWAQATDGGTDINGDPVASADPGTGDDVGLENLVTVTGGYGGATFENDAFENVDVVAADPGLSVTKTANITSDAAVGDVITYTYVVSNTGNVALTSVALDDQHDSAAGTTALTVAGCSVTTDATVTSGASTLNANDTVIVTGAGNDTFSTFGPGDVVTCTSTYTVTQADVDQLQ